MTNRRAIYLLLCLGAILVLLWEKKFADTTIPDFFRVSTPLNVYKTEKNTSFIVTQHVFLLSNRTRLSYQKFTSPQVGRGDVVHVVFIVKYAFANMKISRTLHKCVRSIVGRTHNVVHFHILADLASFRRISRILKSIRSPQYFKYSLYNIGLAEEENKETIELMRKYFFTKDVGRYNDNMFFITEVFHRVFPTNLKQIIFLDLDLVFLTDIINLHLQFAQFRNTNIIGIGNDLQPQYRADFKQYRKKNYGTIVGGPKPHGRQGFNTGVMLMDLDRMRNSSMYNYYLHEDNLRKLVNKYEFKGYLGHQDFFTLLGMEHYGLFHVLDCKWNRQLDTGWRKSVNTMLFDQYHSCSGPIEIYHANGNARLPSNIAMNHLGVYEYATTAVKAG